ncbi:hypothetical protein AB0B88_16430 [Micromonospora haikouensis]|uniref:hypothetical protein n=1 Tax=Actinomycetes TaxID=1760 RepID=UPI0033C6A394
MPGPAAQTRDPLPDGAPTECAIGVCPVCGSHDVIVTPADALPITRSVEPGPDGRHVVHFHHDWCPVFTRETPAVACPICEAPVHTYTYRNGFMVTLPGAGPAGGPGTLVGTMADINPARLVYGHQINPAPQYDKADVEPCGHTLEGEHAQQVDAKMREHAAADRERKTRATISEHADILDAAQRAGHEKVAQQYRRAVRTGSADASGLLAALRTLTGKEA